MSLCVLVIKEEKWFICCLSQIQILPSISIYIHVSVCIYVYVHAYVCITSIMEHLDSVIEGWDYIYVLWICYDYYVYEICQCLRVWKAQKRDKYTCYGNTILCCNKISDIIYTEGAVFFLQRKSLDHRLHKKYKIQTHTYIYK